MNVHRISKIAWMNGACLACPECGGTGGIDSGGVNPWGSAIILPCPACKDGSKI